MNDNKIEKTTARLAKAFAKWLATDDGKLAARGMLGDEPDGDEPDEGDDTPDAEGVTPVAPQSGIELIDFSDAIEKAYANAEEGSEEDPLSADEVAEARRAKGDEEEDDGEEDEEEGDEEADDDGRPQPRLRSAAARSGLAAAVKSIGDKRSARSARKGRA